MKLLIFLLKTIAILFLCFVLLCMGFLATSIYWRYGRCIRIPNGVVIAREAFLNPRNSYFTPNVVVKGPDGTVFSRGNDVLFYFSQTTALWNDNRLGSEPSNTHFTERLAYRPDLGLVRGWESPDLIKQVEREMGPLLEEGKRLKNTNILGVLTFLKDAPEYKSWNCDIPLLSMQESYP